MSVVQRALIEDINSVVELVVFQIPIIWITQRNAINARKQCLDARSVQVRRLAHSARALISYLRIVHW